MMNRQEILQLIREHFKPGGVCDDGSCSEYYGNPDAFVEFAKKIYHISWYNGYESGGCDGGH
jgi:hypothetical protein